MRVFSVSVLLSAPIKKIVVSHMHDLFIKEIFWVLDQILGLAIFSCPIYRLGYNNLVLWRMWLAYIFPDWIGQVCKMFTKPLCWDYLSKQCWLRSAGVSSVTGQLFLALGCIMSLYSVLLNTGVHCYLCPTSGLCLLFTSQCKVTYKHGVSQNTEHSLHWCQSLVVTVFWLWYLPRPGAALQTVSYLLD